MKMKQQMYAIHDVKTGIHYGPACYMNNAHAIREFTQIFNSQNNFSKFPADFNIINIGTFDDQSGFVTATEIPSLLCNGSELIQNKG